jgi:endonuclease-3
VEIQRSFWREYGVKETKEQKAIRTKKVVSKLRKYYPEAKTALGFVNPLQLLIATILSAQCTDERVNKVTPHLFKKYSSIRDFAEAIPQELEKDIYSTGFYKNKAKNIIACCKEILSRHKGLVPSTMDALVKLPGVGRKTANCVLGGAFGINEGIVVDTHVRRLSQRMGLTSQDDPVKIEEDLMELVPKIDWYDFSNMMILHGRHVCDAKKPVCSACNVNALCPSAKMFMN